MSDRLTTKERLFVEAYLGTAFFNGTQAARLAGYGGDDNTLASIASQNLRKLKIQRVVESRVREAAMPANEVLARLTDIARGKVTDLVDEDGKFDLAQARKLKKDGLLKKLKTKRTSKKVDRFTEGEEEESETFETSLVYEEVEFEMYSAHEALRDLGKYHKLFTDRLEHSNPDGTPLAQPIVDAIEKAYGGAAQ